MPSALKPISKKIGKIIFEYKMIEDNDRILIAVSGGKDSLTPLHDFKERIKSFPVKFSFEAIHISTEFNLKEKDKIENFLKKMKVPYNIIFIPVIERLKKGRKMNCYWCSTQRRLELIKYAEANGFNKIALGHHLDDIIQTFLMNVCFKSEIATMMPSFKYKKFPISIIRPLAMVKESEIIKFAKEEGYLGLTCNCEYSSNSKRLDIKKFINDFADRHHNLRENIFNSMKNINTEYML